jgi:hypothetical protein
MTTGALVQCPSCAWWTYRLEPGGACFDCTVGWTACPQHVRLEKTGSNHQRVGATEVLATIRAYRQQHPDNPTNVIPFHAKASP